MLFDKKIIELKSLIYKTLSPYLSSKCAFLELPYYPNVGDLLIWEGTEKFLEDHGMECVYKASRWSYKYRRLDKNITILLQGGGNFGDIWRPCQDFRLKVIRDYMDNPIIILPQSVFYEDEKVLEQDVEEMGRHKNLIICARDIGSYEILKKHFTKNRILLLPDMAFCIDLSTITKYALESFRDILVVQREDKESKYFDFSTIKFSSEKVDFRDWPCMEKRLIQTEIGFKLIGVHRRIGDFMDFAMDLYFQNFYKANLIKSGVRFVSSYKEIYTTRLHVAILCVLLSKPFVFIDNTYSKNLNFYKTWLHDLDNVNFIS